MNFHYDQRPMKQFKFALGFAFLPALALAVWLASPVVRSAGPFTVNSVGDTGDANVGDGECNDGAGNCTLRAAIEEANVLVGTDTITFDLPGVGPHIIQLASGLPELSDSVNLLNSSGESITVRRNTGAALFPVFWIAAGNQTVQISGLTISNGNFPIGGGIFNNGGTLTVTDCTLSGNTSDDGGLGSFGGGIFNSPTGQLTLTNSIVSGNSVGTFGGGGGIYNQGTATLTNSIVSGNSVGGNSLGGFGFGGGGGINNIGTLTLTNSTVSGNSAHSGGGINNWPNGTVTLTNSTVSGNSAIVDGGGIFHQGLDLTLTGVTVTNNRADSDNNGAGSGGGIYIDTINQPLLRSTIVAGNFNEEGATDSADDISNDAADAASSYNLIGTGGSGGLMNGVNNNQVGVADPGLLPLASNGGPTQTHALALTSPAIDKGNRFGPTKDQRGSPRPLDYPFKPNAAGGDGSDIGAFELFDRDGDGVIDTSDNCLSTPNTDQADADGDGIGDACDACPNDAANDVDEDGVCGAVDNCPTVSNPGQEDADHDGIGDACDPDDDNDGVPDTNDCAPFNPSVGGPKTFYRDSDGDGFGDPADSIQACTQPSGYVSNNTDNCPAVSNPSQSDMDHDGIGDACDLDMDGDGVPNATDNCSATPNPTQSDFDGDHIGDACEVGPVKPTNKDQCKGDGWKIWTPRFKNQGDCIQYVNTGK